MNLLYENVKNLSFFTRNFLILKSAKKISGRLPETKKSPPVGAGTKKAGVMPAPMVT